MIGRTIVEVFCFEHFRGFNCAPLALRIALTSKRQIIGLSSFQDKSAVKGTNVH
jgi:hypothetical protein